MASWIKINHIYILDTTGRFLFYWMFYDHLSAHSLLVKLGQWGWLMRMRLAWKKSLKTLFTPKILHQNKTRSTGSAGKGTWSQLCHYCDCRLGGGGGGGVQVRHLKAPSGVWNVPARWRLQPGHKLWSPRLPPPPPDPMEDVFNFV